MKDTTWLWMKAALIRAIKTMAQTAVALIGTSAAGILAVDWMAVLSASTLAGILSILTSVAGLPEVQMGQTLSDLLDPDIDEEFDGIYDVEEED